MAWLNFAFPVSRLGSKLADGLRRIGQWWLAEFLALFPSRVSGWLTDRGSRTLLLGTDGDVVVLQLLADGHRTLASARIGQAEFAPAAIDAFLRSHGLQRKHVRLGPWLPPERIFARRLILPVETRRSLDAVVTRDLVAKTPFQLGDIYHDYVAQRRDGKIVVWQWVVRRTFVADVAQSLGLDVGELAFVESEPDGTSDAPRPVLRLARAAADRNRLPQTALLPLAATAMLLAALALWLTYARQQSMLDTLAGELTAARAKAQSVRAAIDKLDAEWTRVAQIRSRKRDTPGVLDVWDELTRIVPSHSWLTELRISDAPDGKDRQVLITGYSAAAATLVGLVEKSALFRDASLMAPISLDHTENKERFAIQATIRKQDQIEKASR
jgi:general secretion pathway protein L